LKGSFGRRLDSQGRLWVQCRRAVVERFACAGHPWVLIVDVVEPFNRLDVDDGQNVFAQHADGQLFAFDELFNERGAAELRCLSACLFPFGLGAADIDADAGALPAVAY
jgi:hypothetical protein